MGLIDDNFLLTNDWAKKLFNDSKDMPIIDYHCHLSPQEMYENKNYKNLARVWINEGNAGDHYKWRLMRANGVPESLITGDGDDFEKVKAYCKTMEKAVGNPLYEWSALELRRYFGITDTINEKNAKDIWDKANEQLAKPEFRPRQLLQRMNVKVVCTTDDPASDLKYHKLLKKEEKDNGFKVLPAMRPDKAFNIKDNGYADYIKELGSVSGVNISSFADLAKAFDQRYEYFSSLGGKLSDHGINTFHFAPASASEVNDVFQKGLNNDALTDHDVDVYLTALIQELMRLNKKYDWTMQFHGNVVRNGNSKLFAKIGADCGGDSMGTQADFAQEIMKLLENMQEEDNIPKLILYSLNPNDWMQLASGMGDFYGNGVDADATKQKLQLGCAWWFNDTRRGMDLQLHMMAENSLLGNFVGMLTDSRSFLSYSRHEYFRRVLCNYLGGLIENGEAPADEEFMGQMAKDIAYNNAHDYFQFGDIQ